MVFLQQVMTENQAGE